MRRLLTTGLLLSAITAFAQTRPPTVPETPAHLPASPSTELPDAPDPAAAQPEDVVAVAEASFKATGGGARSCGVFSAMKVVYVDPSRYDVSKPCTELIYPYQRFLTSNIVIPMTWQQKGYLALHELTDPANFGTILGISAITVGADSHSAYGPGLKGFGKSVGVSLLQDATAQFFGAFAIPVIVHQDPRYFYQGTGSVKSRMLHAASFAIITRSDSGKPMPNYSYFLGDIGSGALSNLYYPHADRGIGLVFTNAAIGIAGKAGGTIIREFFSKRITTNVPSDGKP